MSTPPKRRVCVIGCGPAGMAMLFELGKLPDTEIPDIVCYEKQDTVGGLWNATWRTGEDKYGEHNHASMYSDLWINNPKESLEFPDYTYERHFGKLLPSYAPRAAIRDYLEGRFTRGSQRDLKQFVRFATVVRRVEYNKGADDFSVTAKDLRKNTETTERFSHVVVASGMFTLPRLPEIPGIDKFRGRVLHSKNVKHLNEFRGQRVLVIGAAWSGEDLSMLCLKFGAKSVILSYKYQPWGPIWPQGITERPVIERFQGTMAYFKDGTSAEVDVVLFCTGYQLDFPFMSEDLRLKSNMLHHPEDLYKGVLWVNGGNNKCMYIGMQYNIYCFNLYAAQAILICQIITGNIQLLSIEEMRKDNAHWAKKVKSVAGNADFSNIFPVFDGIFQIHR